MKSGASPQQLRAKPQPCLGCCGLLYPLSLAWKPKTPMEPKTLCQTQHQGATSHFSNCQPQCLPPPGTDSQTVGFASKILQPQLILLKEFHIYLSFLGLLGKIFPSSLLPPPHLLYPAQGSKDRGGGGQPSRMHARHPVFCNGYVCDS